MDKVKNSKISSIFEHLSLEKNHEGDRDALLIRQLARFEIEPADCLERIGEPIPFWFRRALPHVKVMHCLDVLLQGFGVEPVVMGHEYDAEPIGEYINTGDMYNGTIAWCEETREFYLTTYADFLEAVATQY